VASRWLLERRGLPGLRTSVRTSVRSETVSDALAGLWLGGGEHAVLAAADDRDASRLDDPAADSAFVGAEEIWELDELVTDDELEEEAAGAEVVCT
jgi:hypothetical protein